MRSKSIAATGALLPLLGLMLAHFTNDFYANFLPVLIPLLKVKFELTHTLVGIMSAAYTATGSFLQLLFGYVSDRLRHWRFTIVGPMITGFFMSFLGLMPSYGWVLGALTLAALGTAMFHPQGTSTAGRLFTHSRGLFVSLFIASGTLGFSLGPITMALFVDEHGIGQTPIALIPLGLLGVIIWLLQRAIPEEVRDPSASHGTSNDSADTGNSANNLRRRHIVSFGVLWGLVVLRHAILLAFLTYYLLLLQEQGVDYITGSLSLFAVLLSGVFGGVIGGYISDRFGRWPTAVYSLAAGFAFTLGFLILSEPFGFLSLLVGTALLNASNPIIVAFAQEIAPGRSSTASAVVMGFGWGFGGLLVSAVGVLADASSISNALWLSTLIAFVCSIGLMIAGQIHFRARNVL